MKIIPTIEKAECFIKVFGEAPWNEGWKSTKTGKLYPLSTTDFGDDTVEPFYDKEKLAKQREARSQNEGYVEVLLETLEGGVGGFILGRESSLGKLNEEKLGVSENDLAYLEESLNKKLPGFTKERFFYNADLGMLPELRGQGNASTLYKQRLEKILNNGIEYALVRTTKKSDKPYKRYKDMGYEEVYSYNDAQERVILAAKLSQ